MSSNSVVIAGPARTAIGNFMGVFTGVSATELGAASIKESLGRANVAPELINETLMGCVLPAGLGQAPARQASLGAGIPKSAGCVTVSKVCGSGMKSVMMGHDSILAGTNEIVVAGGMEAMTNAPHLLPNSRTGIKFGAGAVYDHMAMDGLEDAYERGTAMGVFAEKCATEWQFSRDDQDAYSERSINRAKEAISSGKFAAEIVGFDKETRKGTVTVDTDEKPGLIDTSKIGKLRPAFVKDGTVTAANASAISDGAASMVLMTEDKAAAVGAKPVARIVGHTSHANEPEWFTTAPVSAMKNLLEKVRWSADEVDVYEINEAFAVVVLAAMRELNLPAEKVNIHGGAIPLGHPIGASGARIIVTLLNALQKTGGKKGIASLCIGGGEATAIAVELL